jgi:mannose/fructose/N-acetylgalactosamine-specific phosphotransferase system component IID
MFLGGLWHGAGIGFIVWGLYHGLLLVIYRISRLDEILTDALTPRIVKAVAVAVMFHLVCIGWIFFRATPAELLPAFKSLIGYSASADWVFVKVTLWGLAIHALPLIATELAGYRRGKEFVDLYETWHWVAKAAVYVGIFYAVVLFGARTQNEFIYFQF